MILMMVMCTIIFAISLSTRMSELGLETQRLMDYTQKKENNYMMARSAIEMGIKLLSADNGETDSLQDYWAMGEMTFNWEGRPVSVRVVDEESKFPLSALQKEPDDNSYLEEALERFMVIAGVKDGPAAKDQFLDWVDSDGQRRSQGAEEADYDDRRKFKDGPCHSIYEVLSLPAWQEWPHMISPRKQASLSDVGLSNVTDSDYSAYDEENTETKGEITGEYANDGTGESRFSGGSFNNDVPEGQTVEQNQTSPWDEWVSVYSSGKVNINTAPKEILRSLDESMTETLVSEIDSRRRTTAFKNVDELRNIAGFDEDLRHRLGKYLCVKSTVFELRAIVYNKPGTVTVKAIVGRDGGGLTIKRWEVK